MYRLDMIIVVVFQKLINYLPTFRGEGVGKEGELYDVAPHITVSIMHM